MRYTEQFMDTCFSFGEGNKLKYAFGAALYRAEEIMGKVIVLYGAPATGKTSILKPFARFSGVMVYQDFDLKRLNKLFVGNDEIVFAATNRPPFEELPDYVEIIRTSGNIMPFEDWKKFEQEMLYCPEEFFKSCMEFYVTECDANKSDSDSENFLDYLYANYGLSTRARNSLARARLLSYSDISNFVLSGKNINEYSKYANHNPYGIRNFGEECYKELVRTFNEFENNHNSKGEIR